MFLVEARALAMSGPHQLRGGRRTSWNPLSAVAHRTCCQLCRIIAPAFCTGQAVQDLWPWTVFFRRAITIHILLLVPIQAQRKISGLLRGIAELRPAIGTKLL